MQTPLSHAVRACALIKYALMYFIGLTTPLLLFAQQTGLTPLTAVQVDKAAARFLPPGDHSRSLHAAKVSFRDGAKGYDTWISSELPSTNTAPFKSAAARQLHGDYCMNDAVVLGTALTSTPHLTQAGTMIVTSTHFKVDDIIKQAPNISVGAMVRVVREGGEVMDQGELLRIRVDHGPDYQVGKEYLLFLNAARGLPVYYSNNFMTISVRGGRVIPSSDVYVGMKRGDLYQEVKSQLESTISQFPCNS
jgi:hypothetical protein